jgi:hypothetical protein
MFLWRPQLGVLWFVLALYWMRQKDGETVSTKKVEEENERRNFLLWKWAWRTRQWKEKYYGKNSNAGL